MNSQGTCEALIYVNQKPLVEKLGKSEDYQGQMHT